MTTVACPTCQRPVEWSDASPWRPFCSERCKMLDLGAWMTEQRGIPGDDVPGSGEDDSTSPERLPPRH